MSLPLFSRTHALPVEPLTLQEEESLLNGSRNHLRAFTGRLTDLGVDYAPVYISQKDYDAIVSSPVEKGQ